MTFLRTVLAFAVAAGAADLAHADTYGPPGAVPPPPPGPYAEPPPPPPPVQLTHRVGLGLQVGGLSLTPDGADDSIDFDGAGLHFRYRLHRRWSLELSLDGFSTEWGEYDRSLGMVSIGAHLHLTPDGNWDWYLLAGIGGAKDEIKLSGTDIVDGEVELGFGQFGAGVERRFNQWGLGAELRFIGLSADEDTPPVVAGEQNAPALPLESSAAQFNIHASYYF